MTTPFIEEMRKAEAKHEALKKEIRQERFTEKNEERMKKVLELTQLGWREKEICVELGIKHSNLRSFKSRMRKRGISIPTFKRGKGHPRYGVEQLNGKIDAQDISVS
jgi:hypothetical protein